MLACRKRTGNPPWGTFRDDAKRCDEAWGETGLHARSRVVDFGEGSVCARLATFDVVGRRCGLDPATNVFAEGCVPKRGAKCEVTTEQKVDAGAAHAETFPSLTVGRIVAAGEADVPVCTPGAPKKHVGHATDPWTVPTVAQGPDGRTKQFEGHAVGAPVWALHPSQLGLGRLSPDDAPVRPANGCQTPLCCGTGPAAMATVTCGHHVCGRCAPKECVRRRVVLRAATAVRGRRRHDWVSCKMIRRGMLRLTKTKSSPRNLPLALWAAPCKLADGTLPDVVEVQQTGDVDDDQEPGDADEGGEADDDDGDDDFDGDQAQAQATATAQPPQWRWC